VLFPIVGVILMLLGGLSEVLVMNNGPEFGARPWTCGPTNEA